MYSQTIKIPLECVLVNMSPTDASIEKTAKALRARIDAQVGECLSRPCLGDAIANTLLFHTLFEDLQNFTLRPGKRIRPLLFLQSAEIFSREPLSERGLIAVAASLEMLHAFILIHDDLIDHSETRRGEPSLHKVLESRLATLHNRQQTAQNLALVLGDVLFARAQQAILQSGLEYRAELLSLLLDYLTDTGCGELADILYGVRDVSKVSHDEIEQMYWLKTTLYTIECPLVMGAVLAGCEPPVIDALKALAKPAGLAFQIQNDLKDFARFEVSDDDIPDDLLEGKKTLLVRTAYELLGDTERTLLQLCLGSPIPTESTVAKAKELILKSGAEPVLRKTMETLFEEACVLAQDDVFYKEQSHALLVLLQNVRKVIG